MLEYPIEDAFVLLNDNLITAEKSLADVNEDLEFITDQCTTVEVGILSLYCLFVCLYVYFIVCIDLFMCPLIVYSSIHPLFICP